MKSFTEALRPFLDNLSALKSSNASAFRYLSKQQTASRLQRRRKTSQLLTFEKLQPRQLLATFATNDGSWNDPDTWSAGVPDASQRAIINQGVTVELDGTSHAAKELVVQGNLVVTEEANVDKTLQTRWVHVNSNGVFEVGSADDRYDEATFTLTLTGTDVTADHTIEGVPMTVMNNDGFLMTAGGGQVQFFGEDKLSFTKLALTAKPDATEIIVENYIERNFATGATDSNGDFVTTEADDGAVNWKENDQIVIASSSYDYTEEEVRTIETIKDNGNGTSTVTFAEPLEFRHYGKIETYSDAAGGAAATRTYEIDMRAEVALLSRNIKIQGDPNANQDTDVAFGDRANLQVEPRVRSGALTDNEAVSPTQVANGVGGHLMFMGSSGQIRVDGVQLDGLGQASQKGRYPIHWHNGGDRAQLDDVFRNSSITNSNNRGVTIHGTSGLRIEDVVLHDIHGHGFFFEDAIETNNVLVANIALGIHAVGGNDSDFSNPGGKDPFVVDTHDSVLETGSRFSSSAAFWITNPNNTFIGNIAAGAGDQRNDDWAGDPGPAGTGFWFAIPRAALGDAMDSGVTPIFAEFGQFDNNTSHTTAVGLNFDRGSDLEDAADPDLNLGNVQPANEYSPRAGGIKGGDKLSYFINGFTNYKASDAAFYHRGDAESIQLNGLRVADSYNGAWAVSENIYNNSLFVGNSKDNADLSVKVGGPRLYDGAGLYTDSHFAGFAGDNAYAFQVEGSSFGPTMYHAFRDTSFEDDGSQASIAHAVSDFTRGPNGEFRSNHDIGRPAQWVKAALDLDGTLTSGLGGGAGFSIVPNVDFLVDNDDIVLAGGDAVLTDDIYARIRVQNKNDGQDRFEGDFKNSFNETLLRFANRDGKTIEATEGQNNGDLSWIQTVAKTDGDGNVEGTFTVEFGREGLPENGFVLNMKNQDGGRPELNPAIQAKVDAARIVVKIVGAQNYTPGNGTEVFNDTDLRTANDGVTYYRDTATGDLYLNTGIVDSQNFIEFTPNGNGPLQSTTQSRKVEYGTKIEAEQFDTGIEGIAFQDTDNSGTGVTSTTVDNITGGEWLEYTTEIVGNAYDIGINISSAAAGGKIRVLAGLSNSAGFLRDLGSIDVPDTQNQFETVWLRSVDLTFAAGENSVIRVAFEAGDNGEGFQNVEFDSFEFASATQASMVPGRNIAADFATTRIELEQYDEGGQGAAYFDNTPQILDYQSEVFDIDGNDTSGSFRANEDVDANSGGLSGKVFEGEWLEYTTDIEAGIYDITLFKIWGGDNNAVKLFIADSNSATEFADAGEVNTTKFTELGVFDFQTGDNNEEVKLTDIDLTPWAGTDRVIRIEIVGNWMGLDYLEFESKSEGSADTVAPTVESVVVNDGDDQRSMVTEITVNFSEEVTGVDANSFVLTNTTTNTQVVPTVTTQLVGGKTVATLTFNGSGIVGGSLADGNYTLTTLSGSVSDNAGNQLDGNDDGTGGDNATDEFFRLFGDVDGDRDVDRRDLLFFRRAFNTTSADLAFSSAFDVDGDGDVDRRDLLFFRRNFNKSI